jgi:hypothetical protein
MEKILPEIIFGSSDPGQSKKIGRWQKNERLRKLIPRVYTSNFKDSDEIIVKRNLWVILGHLYPGAVVSHRSALEGKLTSDGHLFLTYKYKKIVDYPGVTIHLLKGPKATEDDPTFISGLYISSQSRAFMENLQESRETSGKSKILDRIVIEDRLDQICRIKGEDALNKLRDDAQHQAVALGMDKALNKFTRIVSAILSTHTDEELDSPLTKARAQGLPYDPNRIELFSILFSQLQSTPLPVYAETQHSKDEKQLFAFFEAYFSNYIEGTVFELDEAREIVFDLKIPQLRPADAHDVLGTFKIVSNQEEMNHINGNYDAYQYALQSRHLAVMEMRPDKSPGQFKLKSNRAGSTHFVEPDLVRGTLLKGWEMQQGLPDAISKAIFQMFLVSEVHPFEDGNGRIARIMMNAELCKANLQKIIIPTVFRENYLLALRALSRSKNPAPLIEALIKAQSFSARSEFKSWNTAVEGLTQSNAFEEPDEARLVLPS